MQTTFINARILNPVDDAPFDGFVVVSDGMIVEIGAGECAAPKGDIVECGGQVLAPGIIDWGVHVGEPGARHKESYASAGRAAAAGGVTTMVTRPDTDPVIDTPEKLAFISRRAAEDACVRVRPMAALTKERAGREMTEIGFLQDAGAVALSDSASVVENSKVFIRALTYAKSLGALVVAHPQEPELSRGACASKGVLASSMGLPDVSPMAERMGLDRDVALVEMTGASYHADSLSAARALPALERAKANGFDVTAGVNIHHLVLNEQDLGDYRTFFKFTPPLRAESDRKAMVDAVARGLIDVIGSFHTPQDEESKRLPFEVAACGAVGLQTLLPAALGLYHSGELTLGQIFRALTINPAKRLGLDEGRMDVGAPADFVLFNPEAEFTLDRFALLSKSKNTPFDGAKMRGQILGTWVGGRRVFENTIGEKVV